MRSEVDGNATEPVERETAVETPSTRHKKRLQPHLASSIWNGPQECKSGTDKSQQLEYLSEFERKQFGDLRPIYLAPETKESDGKLVASEIILVHEFATRRLGASVAVPEVYLHATAVEMRKHACVPGDAVAYYDGAIHLASLKSRQEMITSLRHEFAHHVLSERGIAGPFWLHEGFAMSFASERPPGVYNTWRENHVDLEEMVSPIPAEASDDEVLLYYQHAYVMYEFLDRLCLGLSGCGPANFVEALTEKKTTPEDLFLWTTQRRLESLSEQTPLEFWNEYELAGNFKPEVHARLLARAGLGAAR